MHTRPKGFTLVEVMVVVAIVALLATIAGVVFLRARMVTFEQLAVTTLHTYTKTLGFYVAVNNQYPADLTVLGTPTSNPPYLDSSLIGDGTTVQRQGYAFTYANLSPTSYTLLGNPQQHGVTGGRHFFSDDTGAIRFTFENRDATVSDPVLP
jgi:prepilin-type N-terminal cleavage/methylation domain-containing protein